MRTTPGFPDALLRQFKGKAALDSTTLQLFVRDLVELGLQARAAQPSASPDMLPALPSIRLGWLLDLPRPSNSALFDEKSAHPLELSTCAQSQC